MEGFYRVLTADDEFWCRQSMRSLIDWKEYHVEFLEPACDGEEVLERLSEEPVDILLTDINMPFLSGLELIERVHKEYPQVVVIAVSGYDDFEKVKKSFKSGAIDYLLKPVGQEELVDVLTKAFSVLEERWAESRNSLKMSSYLEDNEYSALLNHHLYDGNEHGGFFPDVNNFKGVSMGLVKFYHIFEILKMYDNDIFRMSYEIKKRIRDLAQHAEDTIIFNYTGKMSEFIIISRGNEVNLGKLSRDILREFDLESFGALSVVINESLATMDDIGKRYRELIVESVGRPFEDKSCVVVCQEQLKPTRIDEYLGKNACDEIIFALEHGNREEAKRQIYDRTDFAHCREHGWNYMEVRQFVNRVRNILLDCYADRRREKMKDAENLADNIDRCLGTLDFEGIRETIDAMIDTLIGDEKLEVSTSMLGQIEQVRDYIEKNYTENLSLSVLAEKFHVEPSYLSRIFSQKYDVTITSFITETRMERAKEMMRDKTKKMETISFMLGYEDYNYFSRVFKKYAGKSPSEYRKMLASHNEFEELHRK